VFPKEENNKGGPGAAKQSDYLRTIPRIRVATVLESEQQLDGGGREEAKADEIKFGHKGAQGGHEGGLGQLVGDARKDKQARKEAADGEIYVEA
jgi:hypothetical protein